MVRLIVFASILAAVALLAGCSTLNEYGIGGKPELQCKYTTGEAYISDRIVGTNGAQAQLTVSRRFDDVDVLCTELIKAKAAADAYRAAVIEEAK